MKCDETIVLIKSTITETAPVTPVQGTSSKKANKNKKSSDQAPMLEAGVEEVAVPSDDAALKAGMAAETEEAEQPQLPQLELVLKCAGRGKDQGHRCGTFFLALCKPPQQKCTVPMGQNCDVTSRHSPMD